MKTQFISTNATTLGPFLALLVTLHHPAPHSDQVRQPGPALPRGAVLAVRCASR
jgi:hypothetical protein